MAELHPLPPRLDHLRFANPTQLCETASLRLAAVQALITVLLKENRPEGARISRDTLRSARGLLMEAEALYRRALGRKS
jgi:hypothetical protein